MELKFSLGKVEQRKLLVLERKILRRNFEPVKEHV